MNRPRTFKTLSDELDQISLDNSLPVPLARPRSLVPHKFGFPVRSDADGKESSPQIDNKDSDDYRFQVTTDDDDVQQTPVGLKSLQKALDDTSEYYSDMNVAEDYVETPMSPSLSVLNSPRKRQQSECSTLQTRKMTGNDHQICYMEQSMETSQTETALAPRSRTFSEDLVGNSDNNNYGAEFLNYEDSSGFSSSATSEHAQHPTHRAMHTFIPRHDDELLLQTGDPVLAEYIREDHWTAGVNLRTGQRGLYPSALTFELNLDEDFEAACAGTMDLVYGERDTFYLTYLGSLEVAHHKGNDVLTQSINKVLKLYQSKQEQISPKPVLMDINFRGIHVIDKTGGKGRFRCPSYDYFYSLQNISFCGAHPKQLRYFSFITKHPLLPRFASHVFLSTTSSQPVVEAIGRAFKKSYDEYMAFAHPTEDIFIE